jgi:dual specificity phosphatase 12
MDEVLPKLYLSSWYYIMRPEVLESAGVTHVLTILRETNNSERLKSMKRMIIEVDDDQDEPLIDSFGAAVQWIDDALAEGGVVCVHW